MAFDGIAVSCVKTELNELLKDGRIDKILQPEKDEIHLIIRAKGKNQRLILSASSSQPRIHLTEKAKDNPEKAPMFCMLLRKHITGGKIIGITQPEFERILIINIESKNEMGDIVNKHLIIEIMGRCSNIILTDECDIISGSIKYIDFSVSTVRQLIPGMKYEMPPSQDKLNPLTVTKEQIKDKLKSFQGEYDKFILNTFMGIGPLSAREIAYKIFSDVNSIVSEKNNEKFADEFYNFFEKIKLSNYSPCIIYKENGKLWDFSSIKINQYGNLLNVKEIDSFNNALDFYFYEKDLKERITQKSSSLHKFIENNISRCKRKIALQNEKLNDAKNKDKYKLKGDLLTSNLYKIEPKSEFIILENYYDNMKPVKITLKPELDPSKNAQRYYKLYQKAKNAEIMTKKQLKLSNEELEYLLSVKDSLSLAENEKDIKEIQTELYNEGYKIKDKNIKENKKQKKEKISKPMEFSLSDGYTLLVGKNNYQNDELTLKIASRNDIWFHTKQIHGSHGVIITNGTHPSDDVIVEAAKICAYFSKARDSANVPVDYTEIKNVKKPNGAKPGMVIYVKYNTINVKPELIVSQN